MEHPYYPDSPRLRWPVILMILASAVAAILIVVLMSQAELPPLGQTPH